MVNSFAHNFVADPAGVDSVAAVADAVLAFAAFAVVKDVAVAVDCGTWMMVTG